MSDGKSTLRVLGVALVLAGILLGPLLAGLAEAQLKAAAAYAWDLSGPQYGFNDVDIYFDGGWVPFWHQLSWGNTDVSTSCGLTRWAGTLTFALYSVDNNPSGAPGFQETRNYELVDCDRDIDGQFNSKDLELAPPTDRVQPPYAYCSTTDTKCKVLSQDVSTACAGSPLECSYEIVTTISITLDLNCDGTPDTAIPTAGLCLFAEARTPPPPSGSLWLVPLSARINAGGQTKTIDFDPAYPTAVKLLSFAGRPTAEGNLITWETASELNNLGFDLYRSLTPDALGDRLNEALIPSASPGGGQGASYQFLDQTASPGLLYYYTLEDVDVNGVRTPHGPIQLTLFRAYLPLVWK